MPLLSLHIYVQGALWDTIHADLVDQRLADAPLQYFVDSRP